MNEDGLIGLTGKITGGTLVLHQEAESDRECRRLGGGVTTSSLLKDEV